MSEEQPHWYISRQPNTNWNEADAARFDSPPFAAHYKMGVDHPNYTPPLDPQQPTPEDMERELYMLRSLVEDYKLRYEAANEVATAARDALANIATMFRHWGYIQTHPLPELRALLDMLTPPAPKWTATEETE